MLNWIVWNGTVFAYHHTYYIIFVAQFPGGVEYTDCFSAEGLDPNNEYPEYDTKPFFNKK